VIVRTPIHGWAIPACVRTLLILSIISCDGGPVAGLSDEPRKAGVSVSNVAGQGDVRVATTALGGISGGFALSAGASTGGARAGIAGAAGGAGHVGGGTAGVESDAGPVGGSDAGAHAGTSQIDQDAGPVNTEPSGSAPSVQSCTTPSTTCADGCAGTSLYTPCLSSIEPVSVPAPIADNCITSVAAADAVTFMCDSLSFTTSIPAACIGTACGLIFDVHGLTQNADLEEQATELAALGREHGYIVVQPTASSGVWSTSDRAPLWSFLERVMRVFHVDPRRVHFTGYSQGGDLTWWALCEHSDVLASVAPNNMPNVTGPLVNPQCFNSGAAAGPMQQLPILYSYGAAEPFASADEYKASVDEIKNLYGLSGDGSVIAQGADGKFVLTGLTAPNGREFLYMVHQYSGAFGQHCVAGSGNGSTSCAAPMDIHWGKYTMKFFIDHPRP
jgi:pimeloyl-ACP methyl ester carboxylesterase